MRTPHTVAFCAALVVVFGCAATACSSSNDAAKDVKVTSCTAGSNPNASGTVTNSSSKASTYTIRVRFNDDAGNQVTTGAAAIGKVESNTTAQWHVTGINAANGQVTCTIEGVTRTVAP